MKKYICFIFVLSLLFYSCNKIDGDERFEDYVLEVGNKIILVEDFTGQKCVNCPDAASILSRLNGITSNHLIIVSMHAGGFSMGTPLFNAIANEYMTSLNLKNNPSVSIDKIINIDGNSNTWPDPIIERVKLNSVCDISTILSYNEVAKKLSAVSDIHFVDNVGEKLGVQYYILRDGIISPQLGSDGKTIPDYEHNHVFSGTLYTDKWGEALVGESDDNTYKKGNIYKSNKTPEFELKSDWDPSKISVVTFVFRYSGNEASPIGEVLQANIVKLVDNQSETAE